MAGWLIYDVSRGRDMKSVKATHPRAAARKAFPEPKGWHITEGPGSLEGSARSITVEWRGIVVGRFHYEDNG